MVLSSALGTTVIFSAQVIFWAKWTGFASSKAFHLSRLLAWPNAISFFNSLISCSTRKCFISYSVYGVVLWYKLFDIIWNAHYVYEMMLELWNLQSGKHCSLTRSGCLQWPFPALPPAASPTQCCNLRLETNNKIFFSILAFLNETINKTHLEPNDNSFCI